MVCCVIFNVTIPRGPRTCQRRYRLAHDNAIDILRFRASSGLGGLHDDEDEQEYNDETGQETAIPAHLRFFARNILKRIGPDNDGALVIDWHKVAESAGLGHTAGTILDLRYGSRLSREDILDRAGSRKRRLEFQLAYRAISRHWGKIERVLKRSRRVFVGANRSGSLFMAPPTRSVSLLRPAPVAKDSEVLEHLDGRFGSVPESLRYDSRRR